MKSCTQVNLKEVNTNLTLMLYLKILYLKSKFRLFGAKIKISSNLLENIYTTQFESAKYKSDISQFFYPKPKFEQISPKTKMLLDLLKNL